MKPLTILMLGGAKRVSLARELIKAGKDIDRDVQIFSVEQSNFQPIESVGKIILGGKFTSPRALIDLNQMIAAYHVDIILPFSDDAVELAVRSQIKHPEVYLPACQHETVLTLIDKVKNAQLLKDNEIPVPETYSAEKIKYPAICRYRGDEGNTIVAYTDDNFKKIDNPEDYLIQEYIANRDEYTVDCFIGMKDNEIKAVVPRVCISKAGKEVVRTQTCRIPQLIGLSNYIIQKLNLKGSVSLHIIYDKDSNRFLVTDIKLRIDDGAVCSINAGVNFAEMIIKESLGENASPVKIWRDGALMTRYMQEVMFFTDGNR